MKQYIENVTKGINENLVISRCKPMIDENYSWLIAIPYTSDTFPSSFQFKFFRCSQQNLLNLFDVRESISMMYSYFKWFFDQFFLALYFFNVAFHFFYTWMNHEKENHCCNMNYIHLTLIPIIVDSIWGRLLYLKLIMMTFFCVYFLQTKF